MVSHTVYLLASWLLMARYDVLCLLLPQTLSGAYMKGLKCISLVICEMLVTQAAFRYECIGVFEHRGRMVHCPMRRCDGYLLRVISARTPQ